MRKRETNIAIVSKEYRENLHKYSAYGGYMALVNWTVEQLGISERTAKAYISEIRQDYKKILNRDKSEVMLAIDIQLDEIINKSIDKGRLNSANKALDLKMKLHGFYQNKNEANFNGDNNKVTFINNISE